MNFTASLALAALFAALGCSQQFADPIGGAPIDTNDPCSAWTTEEQCRSDAQHGCSVQPNPIGCRSSDASCPASSCISGDPFVRRTGTTLSLASQPYRFVGANSWGAAWAAGGCRISEFPDAESAVTRVFDDLVELNARVLRVWAFQSYAGVTGADYSAFERLVSHAKRAGVRLIFVLENQYSDCTRGARTDDWFRSGYAMSYGGYTLSYPDYVNQLVQHFRDEPAILAWELLHEGGSDDFAAMDDFVERMSTLIRVADPNHLIAIGVNNGYSTGTSNQGVNSSYAELHAHPTVDLVDVHDFDAPNESITEQVATNSSIAAALGKPILLGAIGVKLEDPSAAAFERRAASVRAKLTTAYERGFVGALLYDYYPDWRTPSYNFDSRSGDPLGGNQGVLAEFARQFQK
ncbi:MAG TPA: cellulase family glycosylhydrolase [Polyangiaceae bacterium]|nr:cellulase family glycosylhydrolase [Polyangiaceae bacterium]